MRPPQRPAARRRLPAPLAAALVLPLALAIAGCGRSASELAGQAPARLTGMSKADLLACAGNPDRSRVSGGREILVYETVGSIGEQDRVFTDSTRTGSELSVPFASELGSNFCEATFVLENGRVQSLTYRGPSTQRIGRAYGACYSLVQSCLRARPEPGDPIIGAPPDSD